jgi:hypothetical protein
MTGTQEIPRDAWNEFFAAFSEQHEDDEVDVEVLGADIGAQTEARELCLRGISPATSPSDGGLAVMLESPDGTHLTHMIAKPVHVWVQRAADESDGSLEIESADGTKTLLRFVAPTALE